MTSEADKAAAQGLPKRFETHESEVQYWDRADLSRLSPGELHEQSVDREPSRKTTFAVRLDQSAVDLLRALARARGVGPTQLVREWIMERLAAETAPAPAATPSMGRTIDERLRAAAVSKLIEDIPAIVDDVFGRSERAAAGPDPATAEGS